MIRNPQLYCMYLCPDYDDQNSRLLKSTGMKLQSHNDSVPHHTGIGLKDC